MMDRFIYADAADDDNCFAYFTASGMQLAMNHEFFLFGNEHELATCDQTL